jgi:hypothetical protein
VNGLDLIDSFSSIIGSIHKNPSATGAGGVGEDREIVEVGVVAVKQAWRRGEPILARSARSRVLAAGTTKPHLLRKQGVWERTGKPLTGGLGP